MDELFNWENLTEVLNEYAIELRNAYQDSLIRNDRIASGELLNSVEYIINKDNVSISVSLRLADYWKYCEWDTKPHWPPVNKMLEYVKIKPVIPDRKYNGKLPTEQQLAYLIGRKISQEGTKGTNDLHNTVREMNDRYRAKIYEAIKKDVVKGVNVFFSELFYKNS